MNTQLHLSKEKVTKLTAKKFTPVSNSNFLKPKGGFWTSTYSPALNTSGWVDFCRYEVNCDTIRWDIDSEHWFLLDVHPKANLYIIDSFSDLQRLMAVASYSIGFMQLLDFEVLAAYYDGIHLTDEGQYATRLTNPGLYGWDCESTLWFRWMFTTVRRIK